jgi:hypothetical protein
MAVAIGRIEVRLALNGFASMGGELTLFMPPGRRHGQT